MVNPEISLFVAEAGNTVDKNLQIKYQRYMEAIVTTVRNHFPESLQQEITANFRLDINCVEAILATTMNHLVKTEGISGIVGDALDVRI